MRGLLRNNFYMTRTNAKAFTAIMILLGIFVVAMDNAVPSLIIGYMLSVMTGFSLNSIASVHKECATKWSRYKLTVPVRRADIVKSLFFSQLIWLFIGVIFAGTGAMLSIALHGYPFDRDTNIFMLFVVGIGVSLFMGAVFFPLFFGGGEERNEVFLAVSLFGGIGMVMGLTTLLNTFFPNGMSSWQIVMSGIAVLLCGVLFFCLSYPLTVFLFLKKEY